VDGQQRGPAPYTAELCEGEHTVELRSPVGRYIRKLDTRPGQKVEVTGTLIPAGDSRTETTTKTEREDGEDSKTRSRTETKNAMPEFRVTSIKTIGQC